MEKSELVYVTAIHKPTQTFFAQLCKNTEEELNQIDEEVHQYCIRKELEPKPKRKIRAGDYLCAKFRNGYWYRSQVLARNKAERTYVVQMIDYGNIQVCTEATIRHIDRPEELPIFERPPIGINCSIRGSEHVSHEEAVKALTCLHSNYLLINILSPQTQVQYEVDIPRVGYNMKFWNKFDPDTAQTLRREQCGRRRAQLLRAAAGGGGGQDDPDTFSSESSGSAAADEQEQEDEEDEFDEESLYEFIPRVSSMFPGL